jgi:hypothetical protein
MFGIFRRHVMERGRHLTLRHGGLHARGHRAARRHQRLELAADPRERIRHRDHDLAVQHVLDGLHGL